VEAPMRQSLALLILFLGVSPSWADPWPSWRGPTGDGVSAEKGLPLRWSKNDNVCWKVEIEGAGVSAPVVWGERIFLTASTGRLNDQLYVTCYRRADGRLLWHTPRRARMAAVSSCFLGRASWPAWTLPAGPCGYGLWPRSMALFAIAGEWAPRRYWSAIC